MDPTQVGASAGGTHFHDNWWDGEMTRYLSCFLNGFGLSGKVVSPQLKTSVFFHKRKPSYVLERGE